MTVFLLYLIVFLYEGLASLISAKSSFDYDEVQKHFFVGRYNFHRIMKGLSELSDHMFGRHLAAAFLKINLILFLFFIVGLGYYSIEITGPKGLVEFFERGLTIHLSENERAYLLQRWPWQYVDLIRNSGQELYVGNQYLGGVLLISVLFLLLSVSSSLLILNNIVLIRRLSIERVQASVALLRIFFALCVGALIDLCFLVLFLAVVIAGGSAISISIEEVFKASASEKWLEYGYDFTVGNHQIGEFIVGLGIIVTDVDFDGLSVRRTSGPDWLHWIFPFPVFEYDAGPLCHRYDLQSVECADRLRSLYFEHFPKPHSWFELAMGVAKHLYTLAASLACGNNIWAPLAKETGSQEAIALGLPLFAALAVMFLSKFFVIPCLALIVLIDEAVVRLGKYAARSSERALSLLTRHGPALLAAPPIIALAILTDLARWVCGGAP